MTYHRTRIRKLRVAGLLALVAAVAATLAHREPSPSSASTQPEPSALTVAATPPPPRAPRRSEPPTVANLDPDLRAAYHRAAASAASAGLALQVNSGWRSRAHQAELFDDAVAKYGSEAAAERWVATPDTSVHVSGDAIDVGPTAAAAWLAAHGPAFGLCRVYANEPWHFELRPGAATRGCPALYPDPTYDPRLHR